MKIRLNKHSMVHHGHTLAHMGYLAAAVFHGGIYGYMAAALLFFIVLGILIGESL